MNAFMSWYILRGIALDLEDNYSHISDGILSLDTLYSYLISAGFKKEAALDTIHGLIVQIHKNDRVLVEDDIDRVCDYIEEKRNGTVQESRPTNTEQGECDQRCEHELMIGCNCGGSHWLQAFYFVDKWMTEFMVNFIDRPWSFWNRIKMGTKFILGLSNNIYFSEVNIHSRDVRKLRMFIDEYLQKRDVFAKQLRERRRNR